MSDLSGFGYSMYASAIWPTLPFVIKAEMLGTGYGTMTAVQNAGLAIFPSIIGVLMVCLVAFGLR
jgi:hypothetical protein